MKLKKKLAFFLLLPLMLLVLTAGSGVKTRAATAHLIDNAQIFSASAQNELSQKIEELESQYSINVVILTVNQMSAPGLSGTYTGIRTFSEDYYDYIIAGGQEKSGVMLCVCMDPTNRAFYMTTTGSEQSRFASDVERIQDRLEDYFAEGEYDSAGRQFLNLVDQKLKFGFLTPSMGKIALCVGIGLFAAWLIVGSMKSSMKSVRQATSARNYVVPGSFRLRGVNEMFLYRNVTQTARQTQNRSGGGGSFGGGGSSGISHGGGGRRF